jgi:hypothetical protein
MGRQGVGRRQQHFSKFHEVLVYEVPVYEVSVNELPLYLYPEGVSRTAFISDIDPLRDCIYVG